MLLEVDRDKGQHHGHVRAVSSSCLTFRSASTHFSMHQSRIAPSEMTPPLPFSIPTPTRAEVKTCWNGMIMVCSGCECVRCMCGWCGC